MAEPRVDEHLQAEHAAPERTTPQGTQEEGVEHGHEERDVRFRPVFAWFLSVAALTIVSQILLWGALGLWVARAEKRDVVPSMFRIERAPPEPRVHPNPADSRPGGTQPLRGPQEDLAEFRVRENEALRRLGLQDEQGTPTIPPQAVARVVGAGGGGAPPARPAGELRQMMPSDPSGGTMQENQLR